VVQSKVLNDSQRMLMHQVQVGVQDQVQ